jgi:pimeloyl-ACP methyl ester carboxylesterase
MPVFERGAVSLYYEEFGPDDAYPLLLIAPGGMRSHGGFWHTSPFDPTVELADEFRVIAMDQRNAGRSRAPIDADDGWPTYRDDQLALLDHLGIKRCHVMGGCIGCSYGLALVEAEPERITSAVLQNPIGISQGNRSAFEGMFDDWAAELLRQRSDELAQLAPRAELRLTWKTADVIRQTVERVRTFLRENTPA